MVGHCASQHLGEGIKDVLSAAKDKLKDKAKTIGKTAAKKAVAHVADNLGKSSNCDGKQLRS